MQLEKVRRRSPWIVCSYANETGLFALLHPKGGERIKGSLPEFNAGLDADIKDIERSGMFTKIRQGATFSRISAQASVFVLCCRKYPW